jgi:DNA-binding FadR family transcriptional regulator
MRDSGLSSKHVVDSLIEYIQTKKLSVGDKLPSIRFLAEELEVSTNIVRDAMMQAQSMGLVKVQPRSGAYVQSFSYAPFVQNFSQTLDPGLQQVDENLFSLLEARKVIEVELVALAAKRRRLEDLLPVREAFETRRDNSSLDDSSESNREQIIDCDVQFHLGMASLAGNPVLEMVLKSLLGILRPHLIQLSWDEIHKEKTDLSHQKLYQALVDGDEEAARNAMRVHLGMAYDSLLKKKVLID